MNASALSLVVGVLIALLVGANLVAGVTSEETRAFIDASEDWCNEHDGDLYNARVIGSHGGLHCELPNGTSVHMDEVVTNARY